MKYIEVQLVNFIVTQIYLASPIKSY